MRTASHTLIVALMNEQYRLAIGARMRKQRRAIGKTQAQIAKELDITSAAVSQWEAGATVPVWHRHGKVAVAYCTDKELLFAEPPLPEQAA